MLTEADRTSQRERELPAHVMVYYVIALALYMQVSHRELLRCLLEGLRWLAGPDATVRPASPSGISQARSRLGAARVRRLYEEVVGPIATAATPGAWYRAHRVVSLDGTTLDVADTRANSHAFGRPPGARGANATGAFPQLRLVGLVETGTHVVFGATMAPYAESEATLARAVLPALRPGMLRLADRYVLGFDLWQQAAATGAALGWLAKASQIFPAEERHPDGSYRSTLRWNSHCRARDRAPIPVRVIRRTLPRVAALPPADQPRALRAILVERCDERVRSSRERVVARGVKRKMRNDPLRPRRRQRSGLADDSPQIISKGSVLRLTQPEGAAGAGTVLAALFDAPTGARLDHRFDHGARGRDARHGGGERAAVAPYVGVGAA